MPSPSNKTKNGNGSNGKLSSPAPAVEESSRQRANTFSAPSSDSVDVVLRPSKSDLMMQYSPPQHKLDRFGFIVNMNHDGTIRQDAPQITSTSASAFTNNNQQARPSASSMADTFRQQRRLHKWNKMIASWNTNHKTAKSNRKQSKLLKKRLRKGLPDELRTQVWMLLANVSQKIAENPGVYDSLVRQTFSPTKETMGMRAAAAAAEKDALEDDDEIHFSQTKAFLIVQETIERDIHRTFPRHSMFYDVDEERITGSAAAAPVMNGMCGATTEFSNILQHLEDQQDDRSSPTALMENQGGQASLRRLLKAYSVYDRDVGYCQGMNFIAGMLLTLMSEEEAFWLFTSIMHGQPCQMHGMFGEGMSETHKVLYVAEKLIQQFLPRLHKHLERENVHITMFATQWLLTQYTSSFNFDLVTRIWDCFLVEGWKVTYRVMLALLTQFQASLLKMSFEEILAFFRTLPDQVEGAVVVEASLKIPLRHVHIAKYEKEWEIQQAAKAVTKSR